jgi:hypothetical protein
MKKFEASDFLHAGGKKENRTWEQVYHSSLKTQKITKSINEELNICIPKSLPLSFHSRKK